jgi:multisubunit Na+/H+ antiporter MnhF subunit
MFDRLLAVNMINTNVVVILVILSTMYKKHIYLDLVISIILLNFVGTIGVIKCLRAGGLHR